MFCFATHEGVLAAYCDVVLLLKSLFIIININLYKRRTCSPPTATWCSRAAPAAASSPPRCEPTMIHL